VPAIKPQQIEASLANFKDWGELQRSTYEAQARPALDELDRQEALATKQVMVQMAAFGGVDSPAALNALKTVRDDYGRRKEAVARDVSNAVTSSILGLKSQFELFNASQRQQANLANQAADLDAQKTYASLFTSGRIAEMQAAVEAGRTNMMGAIAQMQTQANIMIANADNYLRAIGLDFTREANLRNSFNDFMRIYATDRAMTFQNNLNAFNSFYNILMQGAGLATNLMDRTFGRSEQTTSMPTVIGASIYPKFGGSPYQDIERILDAYNKRQGTS
jgi:enamine deaminase RidA (YjgF/YER057c/UK114 family)